MYREYHYKASTTNKRHLRHFGGELDIAEVLVYLLDAVLARDARYRELYPRYFRGVRAVVERRHIVRGR